MAKAMNKAQAKAQKKKVAILAFMAIATLVTWGKNLFGNSDAPVTDAPVVPSTPIAGAAGGAGPAPAGPIIVPGNNSATTSISITTYDQAVKRMDVWPNALKRRFHSGVIEEIVPFESDLIEEENAADLAGADTDAGAMTSGEAPPPPTTVEAGMAFEDLHLKLSSTAIFGKSRYAKINGTKVVVGQIIEVQVGTKTIRYEVTAIHSREVEIRYSGATYLLRIAAPGLNNRAQGGA